MLSFKETHLIPVDVHNYKDNAQLLNTSSSVNIDTSLIEPMPIGLIAMLNNKRKHDIFIFLQD